MAKKEDRVPFFWGEDIRQYLLDNGYIPDPLRVKRKKEKKN